MDFGKPFFPETTEVKGDGPTNGRHPVVRFTLHIEAVLEKIKTGGYSQVTLEKGLKASKIEDGVGGQIMGLNTIVFKNFDKKAEGGNPNPLRIWEARITRSPSFGVGTWSSKPTRHLSFGRNPSFDR